MTAPKSLSEIRDEMAEVRAEDEFKIGNVHNMSDYIKGYKAGFDASSKVWAEHCESLVRTLEIIMGRDQGSNGDYNELGIMAKQAIERHRLFIEGSKK